VVFWYGHGIRREKNALLPGPAGGFENGSVAPALGVGVRDGLRQEPRLLRPRGPRARPPRPRPPRPRGPLRRVAVRLLRLLHPLVTVKRGKACQSAPRKKQPLAL
jgi:hypothetical protein